MGEASSPVAQSRPLASDDRIEAVGPAGRAGARPANPRLNRIAKAVLAAFGLAFVLAVIVGEGLGTGDAAAAGGRLGGDYPAFHAAGSIVLDGDLEDLYDPIRQEREQADLGVDGFLSFSYPPHVAVAYAPLAALGFRLGYALHTLLMFGAVVLSLRLASTVVPALRAYWWPALAAATAFYPLFRAIGGGQNTALTLLVLATVWWGLHHDREVVVGVAVGLLLFRPQYALPLIGLLFLGRHLRAVTVAVMIGVGTWALTAVVLGIDWLGRWLDQVLWFVERDAEVNASNSISIIGYLQALTAADDSVAVAFGTLAAIGVALGLAWMWMSSTRIPLAARMGATAAGMILLSPHTMFYDAGILLVTGAATVARARTGDRPWVPIGVVWIAAFVHPLFASAGATPLALVVIGVFVLAARAAVRSVHIGEPAHA